MAQTLKPYYPTILHLLGEPSGNLVEIGSGDADFLIYASQESVFEVYGCDIHEHAGLDNCRANRVEAKLLEAGVSQERYNWMNVNDPLPFGSDFASTIVSVQTLEHVEDIEHLFAEVYRVLKPGGRAVHYFPSLEILIEPHSKIPFAHRCSKNRSRIISIFSRLGIGKFSQYSRDHKYSLRKFTQKF